MIDHDRLFKELLQTFFWEFIELFLPEILDYVEQDSLIFLPEEIFTDVTSGDKRKIDLLAQVKWQEQNSYFLIHLESQAYNQKEFERRMFHYFARLDAKYLQPIFPIVIFSYDEPKRPEKSQYTEANLTEEEQIMEIVTSWMEKGIGQGEQKIIKRQLKRRFNINPTLESRINGLSSQQIETLADVIFDFQSLEDFIKWLDRQN